MSTRLQEKNKPCRGSKQAARQETEDWLAGTSRPATQAANRKRPPNVLVPRPDPVTKKERSLGKPAAVLLISPNVSAPWRPVAAVVQSNPLIMTPMIAEEEEEHPPVGTDIGSGWFNDTGVADDDELDNESEGEIDNVADLAAPVQVVTPRRQMTPLAQHENAVTHLTIEDYQAIIADYQERLV